MKVRVKLFALAKQLAGRDTVEVELPEEATVAVLRDRMARELPQLANLLPRMMFAVNAEYAGDLQQIPQNAELACIPPVSGG